MDPKDYYYKKFLDDLKEVLNKVILGGDGHFHIVELFVNQKSNLDNLGHIPKERLGYFLSALAGTILIDQVMFTYFKEDYERFRTMTLYPKITWSIGWCANIKPWQLFEHRIALARGLQNPEKMNQFLEFMKFFIADIKEFFDKNKFQKADWESVKNAMLKDNDIVGTKYGDGDYGAVFRKLLEQK
jgi:hypothetical protein